MKIFDIDFNRLAAQLLPTFLRRRRITLLLHALILPFKRLFDIEFTNSRKDHLYRINHNSQVCSLRAVLNDEFDTELRRITIEDIETKDWLMLYRETENKPVMLGTEIVWRRDMIGSETADFAVIVPFKLSDDQLIKMNSLISYYKLASKRYIIVQ